MNSDSAAAAAAKNVSPGKTLNPGAAFWLLASIFVAFLAASSAPSPLYALYREAWGFSPLVLTLVFASYAFSLIAALLVLGSLSDYRGRREVVLLALVLELLATGLFWRADSVGWLMAARTLQGLATGIATSVLSAALIDLDRDRGAFVNSTAPTLGLAFGALGTSLLVQFAPGPTTLVFELLLALFALQTVAAFFLPETVQRHTGAWHSMRPHVAVPPQARATLWRITPVNTATWAFSGFYLSLGPTLARDLTGNHSALVGGGLIGALMLTAVIAVLLVRTRAPGPVLRGGTVALALGLVLALVGVVLGSSVSFFAGSIIGGAGFGMAFNGSMRSLVTLALPQQRGGLMAGFFVLSYLAFSLPALAAGLLTGRFGLHDAAMVFCAALVLLCLLALVLMRKRG